MNNTLIHLPFPIRLIGKILLPVKRLNQRDQTDTERYLFAVVPDAELQQAIVKWRARIFPANLGYPVATQALYIPLAYIGTIKASSLQRLQQRARSINAPSFKLTLNDAGFWRQSGQIWLGCKPAARTLLQIASQLQSIVARTGGPQLQRPYSPTMTILRKVPSDFKLPAETFKACLTIQHFSLIRLNSKNKTNQQALIENYPLATVS